MTLTYRYGSRRSRTHAFSVERTAGDHFVWTCSCGHVVVQDPRDFKIVDVLIEHATGEQR